VRQCFLVIAVFAAASVFPVTFGTEQGGRATGNDRATLVAAL
jgi:hypothetical protein